MNSKTKHAGRGMLPGAGAGMNNGKAASGMGFVFSVDATLALFLLVLTLITTSFLSAQAEDSPYAKLQVLRSAKDTLAVMGKEGVLSSGNRTMIEGALNYTLPQGVEANLQVYTYYREGGSFALVNVTEYGKAVPQNITLYGARQDFLSFKGGHVTNYSIVRMRVWQE